MKLTVELIEAYLDGSLAPAKAGQLELWLQAHPQDAAKVARQQALRGLLRQSSPQLSAQRSRELWIGIRTRVQAEAKPSQAKNLDEPWYAFIFQKPAIPLGAGFALAALAVFAFVWHPLKPQARLTQQEATLSSSSVAAAPKASVPAPSNPTASALPPLGGGVPAAVQAAGSGGSPSPGDPTEVERALADSGVDGMIDAYLAQSQNTGAARASAGASGQSFAHDNNGSSLVGLTRDEAVEAPAPQPNAAVQGGLDSDGFWNWTPAALALNHRDWSQAQAELQAARAQATAPAERSFAGSALTLLSLPGAPLSGRIPPLGSSGEIRVLVAGRWQLVVESRLASFSLGVNTRIPGFRAMGDSLLMDLTFDRGTFAPGTHFTRLSGETAADVVDAQGHPVTADEFTAPAGATYNISAKQLTLN
jgi:anti-sigma factor RsiW